MNILLVEDNYELSCVTIEYLRDLGNEVVAVAEAEMAIEHLKCAKFDAVMTDVSLPGISGIQLAQIILNEYPKLPVVICSGYDAATVESLLGVKVSRVLVLQKPYRLAALERMLAGVIAVMQPV